MAMYIIVVSPNPIKRQIACIHMIRAVAYMTEIIFDCDLKQDFLTNYLAVRANVAKLKLHAKCTCTFVYT